jgi:hypothetical protein
MMRRIRTMLFRPVVLAVLQALVGSRVQGGESPGGPEVVFRLIRPDRQAATALRLFEDCRAPHPAAALAAWKRATRDRNQLGKPLEAVISFFNPEMVREWHVMHEAKLQLGLDPDTGKPRWSLVVPHDDGTIAALVTSLRLSGGNEEAPMVIEEHRIAVERLGGPGATVAARSQRGLVLAGSRTDLERAVVPNTATTVTGTRTSQQGESGGPLTGTLESGLIFRFDRGRSAVPAQGNLVLRRVIEAANGLGLRAALGMMSLQNDCLAIELSAELDAANPLTRSEGDQARIDPEWLGWVPIRDAVAFVSIAMGHGNAYWDGVFSLADRVDRAAPARANLAPLRTRLNLLATAAGTRLELVLWPHLRGITFCVLADANEPARLRRVLVALHVDEDANARGIANEVVPRLVRLRAGMKPAKPAAAEPEAPAEPLRTVKLGRILGEPLEVTSCGRTVLIGWGVGTLETAIESHEHREDPSAVLLTADWKRMKQKAPDRAGAFWPGRMQMPVKGLDGPTHLVRCLAEGPPVVWTGWTDRGLARDRIAWLGLHALVQRFLETLPLDPARLP